MPQPTAWIAEKQKRGRGREKSEKRKSEKKRERKEQRRQNLRKSERRRGRCAKGKKVAKHLLSCKSVWLSHL